MHKPAALNCRCNQLAMRCGLPRRRSPRSCRAKRYSLRSTALGFASGLLRPLAVSVDRRRGDCGRERGATARRDGVVCLSGSCREEGRAGPSVTRSHALVFSSVAQFGPANCRSGLVVSVLDHPPSTSSVGGQAPVVGLWWLAGKASWCDGWWCGTGRGDGGGWCCG